MSTASALLSMIAPAAPATPQGSTTVDASAFEGLLNAVAGPVVEGEGGTAAAPIVDVSLADDAAGIEVAVSVPGLPAAVQPLLQITGAALSTLVSEAVHAPITVALNTRPVETDAVEAEAGAEATPDVAPEAPVLTNPPRDLAPAAAEEAETVDAKASPVLDVAPLVQPALSTPVADVAVEPLAPASPGPAAPATPTVDGKLAETPAETGPQVRPQVKAEPVDDALVQPLAPVDTTAKAAPAEPLVRPAKPVAEDLTHEPAPTDAVRTSRPTVTDPQVQQAAPTAGDVVAPLTPAPAPDATTKATASAPLTQPAVAPEAAAKAALAADGRPQTQPPVPVEVVVDAAAKVAVAEPLTRPQEPVAADAVTPAVTNTDGKPVETPRAAETPNLRALAERASRPVESNAAVDTAAPAATTTNRASAEPVAQTAAAPSATPKTPAAVEAAVSPEVAAGDDAADLPVEATAAEAAPSAQVAQSAREALSPTLSRTAIEATAQIAAQILKKLDGRTTRFEMSLTPDELGRVDIKLDIDTEGRLAARLAFDNPAAAIDLKGRVDELRRQLEQQGFQLSEDAFEFTQRDSGSSAFDRGQDTRQGQSRAFAAAARLNTEADAVAQPPSWQALSLTPAGVDMKV